MMVPHLEMSINQKRMTIDHTELNCFLPVPQLLSTLCYWDSQLTHTSMVILILSGNKFDPSDFTMSNFDDKPQKISDTEMF